MKGIYIIWAAVSTLLISSCTTTNLITIDTLNPAGLTLAHNAGNKNVILVDNTIPVEKEEEDANNPKNIAIINVDSAKATMLYSIVQFMNEEAYFNNVDIYPYQTQENNDPENKSKPLTPSEVLDICKVNSTDILISLDEFSMYGKIEPMNDNMLELKTGSVLRIYSGLNGRTIQPPIVYTDSLFWFDVYSIKEIDNAIREIATIAADKLVSVFVPSWEKQTRWYYSDGKMKEADKLVKENKWKEAAQIWGDLFDKEEKDSRKAKLASNIALANECLDDIPNAVVWIDIAYGLLPESSQADYAIKTTFYREVLKKREANMGELKEQLGEE